MAYTPEFINGIASIVYATIEAYWNLPNSTWRSNFATLSSITQKQIREDVHRVIDGEPSALANDVIVDALIRGVVGAVHNNVQDTTLFELEIPPMNETINAPTETEPKAFEGDQLPLGSEPAPGAEEPKESPELADADEIGNVPPATDEETAESTEGSTPTEEPEAEPQEEN